MVAGRLSFLAAYAVAIPALPPIHTKTVRMFFTFNPRILLNTINNLIGPC